MSKKSLTDLAKEFGAKVESDFDWKPHVFPKYPAPVLVFDGGVRKLKKMHYGFIPHFERDEKPKMVFHNSRVETIAEKPSFRKAFVTQHCLVPIESFFEYVDGENKKKTKVRFYPKNGQTLLVAGIWNTWKSPSGILTDTFSIITREPPKFVLEIGHDRSPYFVNPSQFQWIESKSTDLSAIHSTLSSSTMEPEFEVERF